MSSLKRYKKVYKLGDEGNTKEDIMPAIRRHFDHHVRPQTVFTLTHLQARFQRDCQVKRQRFACIKDQLGSTVANAKHAAAATRPRMGYGCGRSLGKP